MVPKRISELTKVPGFPKTRRGHMTRRFRRSPKVPGGPGGRGNRSSKLKMQRTRLSKCYVTAGRQSASAESFYGCSGIVDAGQWEGTGLRVFPRCRHFGLAMRRIYFAVFAAYTQYIGSKNETANNRRRV